MTRTHTSFIIA